MKTFIKPNCILPGKASLMLVIFLMTTGISGQPQVSDQPPPGIPADNRLYRMGYLDVTLLGADSTGRKNSTEAIRKAVVLSRDYNLACYFPGGTYLVSDTIRCVRRCVKTAKGWTTANHQVYLIGSSKSRPLIRLEKGAPNFQDPDNPLPVFWLYSMSALGQQAECEGTSDPECGQSNINFNQSVKGIDFDLGGNPGAIAIWHPGAQGATIEDVKINATGAFAGLYNPPGQAGGTYNVEITGGKYGVYLKKEGKTVKRTQGKFIILGGCTFRNQEIAAFNIDLPHPMVVIGFHIIKEKGPVNISMPSDGLTLIDGVIELKGGKVIETGRNSLYMRNVYIKGADEIANGSAVKSPGSWTQIEEYSYCEPGNSTNIIDGNLNKDTYVKAKEINGLNAGTLARNLVLRHVWDNNTFPAMETKGIVNVRDPGMMNGKPAAGDGKTDDSDALEYAIKHYGSIFLPRGNYALSRTLTLGKDTRLFGVARTLTSFVSGDNWTSAQDAPLITTVDDPEATTSLSFLTIRDRKHPLSIEWRAGRNSRVRDVTAGTVSIRGNGGGRWTAFSNVTSPLSIIGTSQPLYMYATNPERAKDPQWEIRDARNVTLYYVKTEAGTDGYTIMTSVRIINSKNIALFGSTGNVQLNGSSGMGMIEIINSDDIIVTHAHPFRTGDNWFTLKEIKGDKVTAIPPATKVALFKRGAPSSDSPW